MLYPKLKWLCKKKICNDIIPVKVGPTMCNLCTTMCGIAVFGRLWIGLIL